MSILQSTPLNNIAILAFAPQRNRQGADLATALCARGSNVTLYQHGLYARTVNDAIYKTVALAGILSRLPGQLRSTRLISYVSALVFMLHIFRKRPDVIVAINLVALRIVAVVCRILKVRVVYYALEYVTDAEEMRREERLCYQLCESIVTVEPNRANLLSARLSRAISTFVLPNTPHRRAEPVRGGLLRRYLRTACGISGNETLLLYSGSYQSYCVLEELVQQSAGWPARVRLILLVTDHVPQRLRRQVLGSGGRAVLIPPVSHEELYDWVADADIGLLPYEDENDVNVKYCSPQKLFDYLACGVPFIGSRRPLLQAVAENVECGVCVDMRDSAEVLAAIVTVLEPQRRRRYSMNARAGHVNQFNYANCAKTLIETLTAKRQVTVGP